MIRIVFTDLGIENIIVTTSSVILFFSQILVFFRDYCSGFSETKTSGVLREVLEKFQVPRGFSEVFGSLFIRLSSLSLDLSHS